MYVSNYAGRNLFPNDPSAEPSYGADMNIDILSNGFKLRSGNGAENASGGTYLFAAFAEAPFKYARAR